MERAEPPEPAGIRGERRRLLLWLGGISLAWAGAALWPVYRYLRPMPQVDPFAKDGKVRVDKLTAAQTYLAVPDIASACTKLDDFNNQVSAQRRSRQSAAELADQWMADANAIKAAIPCP